MEVNVERTGGFAAPATDVAWGPLDTQESGKVGSEIRDLVKSVNFFDLKDFPEDGADQFEYTIEVRDDGRSHRVSFYDAAEPPVPSELREIVKLVAANAKTGSV